MHFSAGTEIWCYIDIVLRFGVCISFAGVGASSGIQPMSAGHTLLQGTNNVQLGSGLVASSVGLNVGATARDVQRFASGRSLSVSIDEQQQRLQHYNRLVAGRSLQPSAVTVSAGFPIIGLPNSNDCAVPTAGNGIGMMCGLGRGMALPRPRFPGLGSAGIPGMVSSGISNMLSSNGLGSPVSCLAPSGTMHVLGSMIRRPRDVQMLQTSQEQRQMLMQEIPLQASQNNGQTASSFNGVNTAYSNQMVSSTNQSFSGQHHLQKPQQQQGHSNQQYPQPQSQNHNQAYVHVVRQLRQQHHQQHQQQQNQYLQSQQQFAASSSQLSPLTQSQPYPFSTTY